ncbi:hypothetical protein EJA72_05590 [Pseudomonas sp. PB120]|uniref:AIPR family protein n=1 Tax=Pseudomonas sp. PB120 TaxID=2494700 RepID=UPI0012FE3737|nr:AIPR family protein [Pseudomonas sp. PB120]MVV47722.1 hypothetical protein [Pseudomonas sp. PB120]
MTDAIQDILASIDELAGRAKISRSRAFAAWYAITFFDVEEDDALEAAAADGGNDQGIDIAFADQSSEEIVVLQALCPVNFVKVTPKSKWDAVISSIPYVRDPDMLKPLGRADLAETLNDLKKRFPTYSFTVGLISLGKNSTAIERSVQAHQKQASDKTRFFFDAQEDICSRYKSIVEAENGIPEDVLNFSGEHFEDSGDYGRAWVGSVSAAELKRLHTEHKDKLFAGNVRLFLGARKGGINEQIIKTAQTTPGNFWALNNGITIVADNADIEADENGRNRLRLKRFSIVNGCQTTSSLTKANAAADAKVLARVISAKVGLKDEIVRFNNSQNTVKIWTVRAVDDIQEHLRKEIEKVGLIYAPKQAGSRTRKDPKIIELDKLAQYLASLEQSYLIQAIDNKSELFDEPYQKIFHRGIKPVEVLLAWLVGNSAEVERKKLADGLAGDPNSNLLMVTSAYWIVYTCYKILRKISDIDSKLITLERLCRQEFQNAIAKYASVAANVFYDAAVDTYDREEYGSFKSTLRSTRFLGKMESKLNSRVLKLHDKSLPDLALVAKAIKI